MGQIKREQNHVKICTGVLGVTVQKFHAVIRESSVLPFSQIDNPGLKAFPVTVSLFLPTELENNLEMMNYQVLVEQVTWRLPDKKLHLLYSS